jgi:hypothetical protein
MTLRRAFAQIVGVSTDFGGDCRNRKKNADFLQDPWNRASQSVEAMGSWAVLPR